MRNILCILFCCVLLSACFKKTPPPDTATPSVYKGTASVTQGIASTLIANLFPPGLRVSSIGNVSGNATTSWMVPAMVDYQNSSPFASDLYNIYNAGHAYANANAALSSLNGSDIITVNAGQTEVFTAFIFADNYFELYANGKAVGKDPVPYTEFNSCIVRFRATRPLTLAVHCVDWEEKLGLGVELNGGDPYHVGDGGFILVLKDANGNIVTTTDTSWKAQTFYTAPITDLSCPTENGAYRYSNNCSTTNVSASSYALHWLVPNNWELSTFDDSNWPKASAFSNAAAGVSNKAAYTNFTDIFDNSSKDASFIWSTNLLLDNEVILRKKVL